MDFEIQRRFCTCGIFFIWFLNYNSSLDQHRIDRQVMKECRTSYTSSYSISLFNRPYCETVATEIMNALLAHFLYTIFDITLREG